MKTVVDIIKNEYEIILIDCSPSLGIITINALTAADSVIIPVTMRILCSGRIREIIKYN